MATPLIPTKTPPSSSTKPATPLVKFRSAELLSRRSSTTTTGFLLSDGTVGIRNRSSNTKERITKKPPGIRLLECITRGPLSYRTHKSIALLVTAFSYATYHAARKTTSIVKSTLDPESAVYDEKLNSTVVSEGWAPFDGSDGTSLLGDIDVAFLSMYAVGMYFSGHLGDRLNLRIFLALGMVGTAIFTALFGVGYWAEIHNFYYFLVVQMLAGLFQSTGWPSVVAVFGNWFGKNNRGLIMGLWNGSSYIGSISGSLIASAMLSYGWGWSFVVPALMVFFMAVIVFLLLPVNPESVGVAPTDEDDWESSKNNVGQITQPLVSSDVEDDDDKAVGFIEACKIPGVAPFALCLFFSKLVAYTFLYWLPFYISRTAIAGKYVSSETSGKLSAIFDAGGAVGGVLAGYISDCINARAITAASFTYCAVPALFLYRRYGHVSLSINVILMFITGILVNGPYALITTAVSADLGTHSSLKGNSRALATVSAIIDGTGSIGAAIGPLLTGYISATSWSAVFIMLMGSTLVAGLLLTRLVMAEIAAKMTS